MGESKKLYLLKFMFNINVLDIKILKSHKTSTCLKFMFHVNESMTTKPLDCSKPEEML